MKQLTQTRLGMALWLTVPLSLATRAGAQIRLEREGPEEVRVLIGDEPFATLTRDARGPFLYPLFGPGGARMTRGFPMDPHEGEAHDHPHHRSLWLAHGAVNGFDFWQGQEHGETQRLVGELQLVGGGESGELVADYDWVADGAPVLRETRRLSFAAGQDERRIDVRSTFVAGATDVVFGDTKEGTLALRLAPTLRLKGALAAGYTHNSKGATGDAVWGQRADWVAYAGPIDGRVTSVAIFDHPANHAHPTWWHARDYGLFAANPFGQHDFEGGPAGAGDLRLPAGQSLEFRWRILLREGGIEDLEMGDEYEAYVGDYRAPAEHWRPLPAGLELVASESFPDGHFENRWVFSDPEVWVCADGALELQGSSNYQPSFRSPLGIALLSTPAVGDFALEAELEQTGREYGHRDLCVFFGFQDKDHYYYAHLATTPDANACNVFLVNGAARRNLLEPLAKGVAWGEGVFHQLHLERELESGRIRLYFDDMQTPLFDLVDKTLGAGRVGFGSFDDQGRFRDIRLFAKDATPVRADAPFAH